ncbi:hypothetical protein [Pedobacter immunditicola]|uniref:hypothetical protein n=1 Tax=Pedobacter immunditicola TaxID=3133440 RepID=UPI00309B318E
MRKLSIIAVVFVTGLTANTASAQLSGATTLNVTLAATQSITVNNPTVALNFGSSANYLSGVNAEQADHLTFASTSGFTISASASGDLTGGTGGAIPISTVKITPTPGSLDESLGGTATAIDLSTAVVPIYTSGTKTTGGTTQASLDVDYRASGGTNYLNRTGTFNSTITYTIAPL